MSHRFACFSKSIKVSIKSAVLPISLTREGAANALSCGVCCCALVFFVCFTKKSYHFRMIRSSVLQGSRLHEFGDEQNHCCFPIIKLL